MDVTAQFQHSIEFTCNYKSILLNYDIKQVSNNTRQHLSSLLFLFFLLISSSWSQQHGTLHGHINDKPETLANMIFVAVKEKKILTEPAHLQPLGQGKDTNSAEMSRCTLKCTKMQPVFPKADSLCRFSIINDQLSVTSAAHSCTVSEIPVQIREFLVTGFKLLIRLKRYISQIPVCNKQCVVELLLHELNMNLK